MTTLPALIAFIDPYWIGLDASGQAIEGLNSLVRKLSSQYRIERVYLYLDADGSIVTRGLDVPCTVRPCARDELDDGFELIRAMDQDMHLLAASKTAAAFLVASMDDRLALSVERLKSQGLSVLGLQSQDAADGEATQRMSQVFDRMISLGVGAAVATSRRASPASQPPGELAMDAINQSIEQWFQESDEMARDSAIEFMNSRRGLPKHVDSRLLFLCSKALGRELTEPEKIGLRGRFKQTANERAPSLPS